MTHLGDLLRHARESKGLSVQAISGTTKIREHILIALETETFEDLPAPVFVRGFLRTLARHLGLNADQLLALYAETTPQEARVPSDPELLPVESTLKSEPRLPRAPAWVNPPSLLAGLIAVFVVAGIVWGGSQIAQGLVAQGNPTAIILPPTGTALAALPPTSAGAQVPAATLPASAASAAPTISFATATPTTGPQQSFELALAITGRSWLRVEVDGAIVQEGTLETGTNRSYTVRKRVTLRAGNAAGVAISINKQPQATLGGEGDVVEWQWVIGDNGAIASATPSWVNPARTPTPVAEAASPEPTATPPAPTAPAPAAQPTATPTR